MSTNPEIERYFGALIESYDILTVALDKAGDRGIKTAKQLQRDLAKGQREALELSKKIAVDPSNVAVVWTGILEATVGAQSRALAFAQAAYQEAVATSSDARDTIEKLVNANRATADAAAELSRNWTAGNPFVEAFQKGLETFGAIKRDGSKTGAGTGVAA